MIFILDTLHDLTVIGLFLREHIYNGNGRKIWTLLTPGLSICCTDSSESIDCWVQSDRGLWHETHLCKHKRRGLNIFDPPSDTDSLSPESTGHCIVLKVMAGFRDYGDRLPRVDYGPDLCLLGRHLFNREEMG